jgi:ABC-type Zn2+ transport system substrate-binding protein/surface adhesin
MADSNYEFNNNDFGIDVLSDLCVAVYDVVDIVDIDVLVAQGGASCVHDETDIGIVHKDGYAHDHKHKHKHDYKDDYKNDYDRWDD